MSSGSCFLKAIDNAFVQVFNNGYGPSYRFHVILVRGIVVVGMGVTNRNTDYDNGNTRVGQVNGAGIGTAAFSNRVLEYDIFFLSNLPCKFYKARIGDHGRISVPYLRTFSHGPLRYGRVRKSVVGRSALKNDRHIRVYGSSGNLRTS